MASERLRVALFGAGRIGTLHARNIAAHPELELEVVCSGSEASASALADELGCHWTVDAADALAPGRVDAVVIASPNGTHIDLLRLTTAAGLPTMCEKPLDLSVERIREAREAILSTGVPVVVAFQRRFDASIDSLIRRVAEGEVGAVEQVVIISRDLAQQPKEYLQTSGGIFRDMTIHELDLARCFVPDVVEVSATGTAVVSPVTAEVGDYDSATIVLRGRGGELVTILDSRHCPYGYDQRLEVFGDRGMLAVGNVAPTTVRRFDGAGTETVDPYIASGFDRYGAAYRAELDALAESVRTGRTVGPSFDDGLNALVLADAALESASTRRAVAIRADSSGQLGPDHSERVS